MTKHWDIQPLTIPSNGYVPNNAQLPFLLYRAGWVEDLNPREVLKRLARNGWAGGWINGVFPFHHYHAESHEVLVNTGEPFHVQLGGSDGEIVEFRTRDVVIIPAGGGHCLVDGSHASGVVGAYPLGQEAWDLKRNEQADYKLALEQIPHVKMPETDPVTGRHQPLMDYWTVA